METGDVVTIGYGAPGIAYQQLEEAVQTTLVYIKQVAAGEAASTACRVDRNRHDHALREHAPEFELYDFARRLAHPDA